MSTAAASAAGQSPGRMSDRVKVPLLGELLSRQGADRCYVWADLGRAQSGLVERLNAGRNCLIVADLPSALGDAETHWHMPDKVLDEVFWTKPVDNFLCWDLMNYMRPEQLGEFSRRIAARARVGCSVHALIQYSGTSMSEIPGRYSLESDAELSVASTGTRSTETPRYSPKALEKAMPELRVERTMLLNNGMQEFIFSVR